MTGVRWVDEREQRAWRALQFMQLLLAGRLATDVAATSDLSYANYLVLFALGDQPDVRARLFELAEALGWEKSRLSHQVAGMTGRGLVKKERCDGDRRGAFVVVTAPGRKAIEAAAPHHVAMARRLFIDPLTPGELAAITSAAEKVLAVLDTEAADGHDDGGGRREERPSR
ncbi:MAG: MarR family transcriptional regulator [Actinomycetota bacterium]|nr:MarR family transcriptional regulator [Actinomycetota bacterium]